jgi:hypothetical protein
VDFYFFFKYAQTDKAAKQVPTKFVAETRRINTPTYWRVTSVKPRHTTHACVMVMCGEGEGTGLPTVAA